LYFHHQKEMQSLKKTLRNLVIIFFCFLAALVIAFLIYMAFTNSNPITGDHNQLTGFIAIGTLVLSALLLFRIAESKEPATYIFLLTIVIIIGFAAEIIPGIIATIVSIVMVGAPKYIGKATNEELIMTEDNITYRSKSVKILAWQDLTVIYYNKQFIQFVGKEILTYPFEQQIIEELKKIISSNALSVDIIDNSGSDLLTNDFYALAFNEKFFVNGVNIFDSYPGNIKAKKQVNIAVVRSNKQTVESHLLEIIEVKGNRCIFDIGIIKYLPNYYALFLATKDRKKLAAKEYSVQTDSRANLTNKVNLILDLEYDKLEANQDFIFSDNNFYRSKIEKKQELYFIQKEQLVFIHNNGIFSDQFYIWEPLGKGATETNLDSAKATAKKELQKTYNIKTKTYQLLLNNKNNKNNFAPKEYFFTQLELIFSGLAIEFEDLYYGLNKIKFEDFYKNLINAETEEITDIITEFFKSFSEKEREILDNEFVQEMEKYIVEFIA